VQIFLDTWTCTWS